MPDTATILRDKTHKGLEVELRAYYTLRGEDEKVALHAHRDSKFLALLTKHPCEQGLMSEEKLDEILLEVHLL